MAAISTWSTTAASNNAAVPDGWPENQPPSSVNNCAREMMAALRTQHNSAEWIDLGNTPTRTGATTFTLVGDQTTAYHVGRRVKCTDSSTLYGTITSSVFGAVTTVTVILDSGSLSASLTAVALGIVSAENTSQPNTGKVLQNLLTNSGFEIWSNSTPENHRTLPDSTTTVSGTTCTSTAHALVAGKLVKDGAGAIFEVASITSPDVFEVHTSGADSGSQWYEMQPGCVAADLLGPDGWEKQTTLDVFREHTGTNTKAGSFYSAKLVPSAANNFLRRPSTAEYDKGEFLEKYKGRQVTFGVWAKTSTASHFFGQIRDDDTTLFNQASYGTAYHTGGGGWEWLEVTKTIKTTATYLRFYLNCSQSSGIVYVSQPTLVFGSSIGEGNYSRPPGEVVNVEKTIPLTGYTAGTPTADAVINMEAASSGKIGKGAAAYEIGLFGQNTATDKYLRLLSASGGVGGVRIEDTVVAAKLHSNSGRQVANANGDIYIDVEDGNWSNVTIDISAVVLR